LADQERLGDWESERVGEWCRKSLNLLLSQALYRFVQPLPI